MNAKYARAVESKTSAVGLPSAGLLAIGPARGLYPDSLHNPVSVIKCQLPRF
jgi:hypothetical protein